MIYFYYNVRWNHGLARCFTKQNLCLQFLPSTPYLIHCSKCWVNAAEESAHIHATQWLHIWLEYQIGEWMLLNA